MNKGVPASPSGHSAEPAPISVVAAQGASVPNADDVFSKAWAAMNRRASLRAEWIRSMPEGHPMRVLATLQNTAACFMTRQAQSDRIDMMAAIAAAKAIEEEAFAQWRAEGGDAQKGSANV